jgi:predicted RNA binding protein YcfA (HicA-like mRNA interferase family)
VKALSGKEFVRLLERHGWRLLRINGSHHIYGLFAYRFMEIDH